MTSDLIINNTNIENMIYEVRGKQVMLDSDLARLYHVETKRINEAVKNNPSKFPERYCFTISEEELLELSSRSKFSTLNRSGNYRGFNVNIYPKFLQSKEYICWQLN